MLVSSVERLTIGKSLLFRRNRSDFSRKIHHFINEMTSNVSSSYEETISTLNTLQSNAATLAQTRLKRAEKPDENLILTEQCLRRTGLQVEDLIPLNVIHVAGTKGKGSVCAFTESILRRSGFKTGFFSSPHLVHVRERIRINGESISKEDFVRHFWSVYNKLNETKTSFDSYMPPYFKFLTLMAFHVFLTEKVDVAVIEVGIGGAYDCTNVVSKPVVCAVTTLDLDHTDILGDTIDSIAWQKGGIFKEGAVAFCADQSISAMSVLYERSRQSKCPLFLAPSLDSYGIGGVLQRVGIPGSPQRENASIALQLARLWQRRMADRNALPAHIGKLLEDKETFSKLTVQLADPFEMSESEIKGLDTCKWPGRCQQIHRGDVTYFLDGAHTIKSMEYCAQWFKENSSDNKHTSTGVIKILVFNCTSGRDAVNLLKPLLSCDFDAAIFSTNAVDTSKNPTADLTNLMTEHKAALLKCDQNQKIWRNLLLSGNRNDHAHHIFHSKNNNLRKFSDLDRFVVNSSSVKSAFDWIREKSDADFPNLHIDVLLTGSLHLVGAALSLLDPDLSLNGQGCEKV